VTQSRPKAEENRVFKINVAGLRAPNGKRDNFTLDNAVILPYLSAKSISYKRKSSTEEEVEKKTERSNSEKGIIERCKKGDREAFNELVRLHQRKVFNLCFRILGNRHEAEDVAQDVFLTVYRAIKSFRGDSAFSTWVHRVAVNNCKNRLKYLRRRKYFHTESMEQSIDMGNGEFTREFKDEDGIYPEEAMKRAEVNNEIQDAINELDDDYRVVITLRDIQEYSYKEISDTLDLKEGTVKSRIHRARMELQRKLRHLIIS